MAAKDILELAWSRICELDGNITAEELFRFFKRQYGDEAVSLTH
jgi:hypothetical protein